MPRKSAPGAKLPWAKAIQELRRGLNMNQAEFGATVGFSAMAVSRWERGAQEPPSHGYIALGNLAQDLNCWYFWERAGLSSENVLRVMPTHENKTSWSKVHNFEIVSAGINPKRQVEKAQLVAVPLLRVAAGSRIERADNIQSLNYAPIESIIAAPKDWCPNPSRMYCLRVHGNSMAPLIQDGYVVAVDTSQVNVNSLDGRIVIAWHKDQGLTISRFRRYDHTEVLIAENPEYGSVTLSPKQQWKIVATVLWWVGKAP